ncbi:MAG: SET domain-containing protein-lysine N-methyltransferase [Saprospiraceae bacterium]|nr:SET domain-containing protein-lysine N-methyltransferase [Saprospiraceae bacterium]
MRRHDRSMPCNHHTKSQLPIIHKTVLHDYYFLWGEEMDECATALGFGSLYNHAIHPNANFILDLENNTIDVEAIKDISAGAEITLNYHGELEMKVLMVLEAWVLKPSTKSTLLD